VNRAAFLDTVHVLALLNPRDTWHDRAMSASQDAPERLVTTEAVLTEVADALSLPSSRPWAVQAIDDLRRDSHVTCVPVESQLFARAFDLYRQRSDKHWSLTDCVSFVVMQDLGLREALTADVHFEQAGFRALLRG
jgi:predicted nucleic acid-binding protein